MNSLRGWLNRLGMQPRELEIVRHVLAGDSVVDWRGMDFTSLEQVDALLRLNKLDWQHPRDARYLKHLLDESVRFLEGTLGRKVPVEVSGAKDVREVFLLTRHEAPRAVRTSACFTLKVMNTINHMNGRELLFHVPISERNLVALATAEVKRVVDSLRETGFPIVEFDGGEKSREALVLKLLAKRETLAAQVYDKIRFRVIVEEVDQIPAVILHFTKHLFPFNYVIPGQSQNEIVPMPGEEAGESNDRPLNESSGPTYRHLDFVVDLPLRLEPSTSLEHTPEIERLGCVVYAMVEFQVVDRRTARANESGQNSHDAYKERQRERVLERLERPFEE
ncbi:MAG: TIGR04552 family protein [Archangium sp.]|nr:TIGR04552 family protein [Archangium sp.]